MKGKLIVVEGLDGSGKATQTALLEQALQQKQTVRRVSFPDYKEMSSALVKMYLNGDFGSAPQSVNAYAASSFYAVDRYASYKRCWQRDYESGAVILADRYVTSNAIYQMVKLPKEEWMPFLHWLSDYEYDKLGLPRPDRVIYLDMPPEASQKLLLKRYAGDESKKDIHEASLAFLLKCREAACFAAEAWGWCRITCAENGEPKPVEVIAQELRRLI